MRRGGGVGAKLKTHESSPLVLFRVRVNIHRVYEYPWMHLLYVRLKFDQARRIIRVTYGLRSLAYEINDIRKRDRLTKPMPNHEGSRLRDLQHILRRPCQSPDSRNEDECAVVLHD